MKERKRDNISKYNDEYDAEDDVYKVHCQFYFIYSTLFRFYFSITVFMHRLLALSLMIRILGLEIKAILSYENGLTKEKNYNKIVAIFFLFLIKWEWNFLSISFFSCQAYQKRAYICTIHVEHWLLLLFSSSDTIKCMEKLIHLHIRHMRLFWLENKIAVTLIRFKVVRQRPNNNNSNSKETTVVSLLYSNYNNFSPFSVNCYIIVVRTGQNNTKTKFKLETKAKIHMVKMSWYCICEK